MTLYNTYLNRIYDAESADELSKIDTEIVCAWKEDRLTDDEAEDLREHVNCAYEG